MKRLFSTAILLCVFASLAAAADNWPNWRGPTSNGVAAGMGYPITWSNSENVLWKASLPGRGASTPAVWGENIVLTCGVEGKNTVLCFDWAGKERWRASLGEEKPGKSGKASGSNSSPVTDGKLVFVYFKHGDFAALDFEGKIVWQKNLQTEYGEDTLWWDLGTSPVLTKNAVVVACMHSGPSYVAAFEKETGKVLWKQSRDVGAPVEAAQSYTTPCVISEGDRETVVVLGADHVTAHEGATGKELWRVSGMNPTGDKYFRSISSAVVSDGLVVAPYSRGDSITAIKLGGSGDVTSSQIAWFRGEKGVGADVPTPTVLDGKVYICGDKGNFSCLDLKTGKEIWSGQLDKNRNQFSSSPVLAE